MILRLEHLPGMDNPRHYRRKIVEELEKLLRSGSTALPDPKRKGFYDIGNLERKFFIHISPANGRVALLATWLRAQDQVEPASCAEAEMQFTV